MKIGLGSDHRGFESKERIKAMLQRAGHTLVDFGAESAEACDYPDYAIPAAEAAVKGEVDAVILICGSGIGMSIAANKVPGARAALCHDELTAAFSRKHNDANVLCLPGDMVGSELMRRIVEAWLTTSFEHGRHDRRVGKITDYEKEHHST